MGLLNNQYLILPVRRRLVCLIICFLLGIYIGARCTIPVELSSVVIIVLFVCTVFQSRKRKSVLALISLIALLAGNIRMGIMISSPETPTKPGVKISGIVQRLIKENRVVLKDVRIDDIRELTKPAAVTLMAEKDGDVPDIKPGQFVRGTGRLFLPRQKRNPGGWDERMNALSAGFELSGYLAPGWTVEGLPKQTVMSCFSIMRDRLETRIEMLFGEESPFFCALIVGDRRKMDYEVVSAMRLTGILHILTISGMHIGLLGMAVSELLKRMGIHCSLRLFISLLFLTVYSFLTGLTIGTIRALIMFSIREYSHIRKRNYDGLTALSIAALAITLYNPASFFNIGFSLSFLTVFGILLLSPSLISRLNEIHPLNRIPALCSAIGVSIAAQVSAAPIQLMIYGYIPILSLPFNIIMALLLPLLYGGGILCLMGSYLCFPVAKGLSVLLVFAAKAIENMALWSSSIVPWICRLPSPKAMTLLFLFIGISLISRSIAFGQRRISCVFACFMLAIVFYALRFDPSSRYIQLDVGQGDGAVLREGRHAVIVDTGPSGSYDMLDYLRYEGLYIDAVILSHLDKDHAGALMRLLESEIPISRLVCAEKEPAEDDADIVKAAWDLIQQRGICVDTVTSGDRFSFSNYEFKVLAPDPEDIGSNERSLVLETEKYNTRMLFTGDIPIQSEPEQIPDIDILKVAHHGSKHSTSQLFLENTTPEIAVISAGKDNSYGHPSDRVIDDLESVGAKVYRTDQMGCITIWLRKSKPIIQTYLNQNGERNYFQ